MTDLTAKIAALEEAAASGVLTVESDGERITYRSGDDLFRAIQYFKEQLAATSAPLGVARPASTLAVFEPR